MFVLCTKCLLLFGDCTFSHVLMSPQGEKNSKHREKSQNERMFKISTSTVSSFSHVSCMRARMNARLNTHVQTYQR